MTSVSALRLERSLALQATNDLQFPLQIRGLQLSFEGNLHYRMMPVLVKMGQLCHQ